MQNRIVTRPGLERLLTNVESVRSELGTPCYAYDYPSIRSTLDLLCTTSRLAGFENNSRFYLAFFALPNLSLFKSLLQENQQIGIACNTLEEIEALRSGGFSEWDRAVFTGGVLPERELNEILRTGCMVNVASAGNVEIAAAYNAQSRIGLRLDFTNSALKGIRIAKIRSCLETLRIAGKHLTSLHAYPGTEIEEIDSLLRHADTLLGYAGGIAELSEINYGGGFWYNYSHLTGDVSSLVDFQCYFEGVMEYNRKVLGHRHVRHCWEPGRIVFAGSGFFVTEVLEVRQTGAVCADVYIDASFTQVPAPKIRNRQHQVIVADPTGTRKVGNRYDCRICGSTTLSTDQLLPKPCSLPEVRAGDLLIILDVGAYGRAGSYNFLGKATPPEVLVTENGWQVIRQRQRKDHLLEGLDRIQ